MLNIYIAGITDEVAVDFANRLGFHGQIALDAADIFTKLYHIFINNDCTLLEINPFTENSDNTGKFYPGRRGDHMYSTVASAFRDHPQIM